jgi:hypothetical protein
MQAGQAVPTGGGSTLARRRHLRGLNYFGVGGDNHAGPQAMGPSEWVWLPSASGGRRIALSSRERPPWNNVGIVAAKPDRAENHIMSVEYVKNVIIDGSDNPYPGGAAEYENKVKVSLDAIKGTGTGTTLLGFFALRSHRVWIVPPAGLQSRVSAGAGAVNPTAAFPPGRKLRDIDGSIDARHRTGVGGGSDSLLHFHPIHWQNGVSGAFTTPEEVLVHELFHAVRQAFGMLRNLPLGGDFLSAEELYSIFVENMYANEKGLALRNTHKARSSNVSPDHSMAHNPSFRDPMRELFAMMPTIGNALARVKSLYNPFRDWLEFSRAHP